MILDFQNSASLQAQAGRPKTGNEEDTSNLVLQAAVWTVAMKSLVSQGYACFVVRCCRGSPCTSLAACPFNFPRLAPQTSWNGMTFSCCCDAQHQDTWFRLMATACMSLSGPGSFGLLLHEQRPVAAADFRRRCLGKKPCIACPRGVWGVR